MSRTTSQRTTNRLKRNKPIKKVSRVDSRAKKHQSNAADSRYKKVHKDDLVISINLIPTKAQIKKFATEFANDIYRIVKQKSGKHTVILYFKDGQKNKQVIVERFQWLFGEEPIRELLKLPVTNLSNSHERLIVNKRNKIDKPLSFIDEFVWRFKPAPIDLTLKDDKSITFNEALLPKLLSQYVAEGSKSLGAPPEYIAVALVIVVGSLCSHKINLQPKDDPFFLVNPNLWGLAVGLPGTKKTPAFEFALRLLDPLIFASDEKFNNQSAKYDALREEAELKLAFAKRDARKILTEIEETTCPDEREELRTLLLSKLEEAYSGVPEIVRKRYKTSNTTLAALHNLLVDNPHGILLSVDEIYGFLSTIHKKGNEDLKAYLLECFSGFGSHDIDRATTKTKSGRNLALSIIGTIQPDKLNTFLKPLLYGEDNQDGLINRFQILVNCLDYSDTSNKSYVANPKVIEAVQSFIIALDTEKFGFAEGTPITDRTIRFCEAAQIQYQSWWHQLSKKYGSEPAHPVFLAHIRKYESLVPILALIFQIAMAYSVKRNKFKPVCEVSEGALKYAIKFASFLEAHAKRIFNPIQMVSLTNAQLLLKRREELPEIFTARDISQKNWTGLGRSSVLTGDALALLESHLIVWKLPRHKTGKTVKYSFNSQLKN